MEIDLVEEVKKKKEFSGLPDSVVSRALEKSGDDVKVARSWLRKYFGVFLTNRVLKGKGDLLEAHISSKKRDYDEFYSRIFEDLENVESVVDFGCGANGFSYEFLERVLGEVRYVGVEAARQLVSQMNSYFEENDFDGEAVCGDLFDFDFVAAILKKEKPDVCFLFQVVDALESIEKDSSLKLIEIILDNCKKLVISVPLVSLGGGKKFAVKRKWLTGFLKEKFLILDDFEMFGERAFIVGRR